MPPRGQKWLTVSPTETIEEKNVDKMLQNAGRDVVRYSFGNQRKPFEQPDGRCGRSEQPDKSLQKKNAGANQYEQFYAWGNETAPVEVVAPRTECSPHDFSVRRRITRVKAAFAIR